MPSILPGFEYDIFISYRQNDNRSGWVTEFVQNLEEELAATIKEPLYIYFDSNTHDGLLETHQVDKSLTTKLKSIILIPIISQTYCDTKCFAWQKELVVFNKQSKQDPFGRDIRLANKNVASRILPMKIHDLDPEDVKLIENELGGPLRSIEFIFKAAGVNRPLTASDNPEKNLNKTFYPDQVNKVANAVKEIIYGIKYPDRIIELWSRPESTATVSAPTKAPDNSIAVLPFLSLTQDPSQDYFADGVMENILIQLASLSHLRVISRTSVMRYKKTTKSAPEIAAELGVKYILEGSALSHGNKARINVQLIDAQKDSNVWAKVFVENIDDIFIIQSNVAETVTHELNATLLPTESKKLKEVPTKNIKAYDLFLKGRHAFNQFHLDGYRTAEKYFMQALELDPEFAQAYSYLASTYSALMSWNGDLSPEESVKMINNYLPEAMKRGATDNDYLTKAFVELFVSRDFPAAEQWLLKAMEIGPNNANVQYTYSYVLNMMGRPEDAMKMVEKAKAIDPTSVSAFNYLGITYYLMGRYEEAKATFKEALQLYPYVLRQYDHLARVYLTIGDFNNTIHTVESGLKSSQIRPPSMVAYLAAAYLGLKQEEKALALLEELLLRSIEGEKGVNVYIAHIYNAMGDLPMARIWLEKAFKTNDIDLIWLNVDPLLKNLNTSTSGPSIPDYERAEQFITDKLKNELPDSLHYHNTNHIQDVLQSAMRIAESENISDEETRLIRIAALFHDSGLIQSHKNHEEKGCDLAREHLPAFGFSKQQIDLVCGMIMATKIPQSPNTLLEKILCDADLDYLGRDDFYEIGSKLNQEMKGGGLIETEQEWNLIQKQFLESHRYHTRYGQLNREHKKRQHLEEITARINNQ